MKYIVVVAAIYFAGCSKLTDEQMWEKVESAKAHQNWDSTKVMCEQILQEYPAGAYASWARFGLAESYRFKNQPREALDNYKIFYTRYPDMQPSALSLFLIGYIYNNNLMMSDSAKYYYRLFIEKFPQNDLVPSVNVELENLGKDPAEVLAEQQKKNEQH